MASNATDWAKGDAASQVNQHAAALVDDNLAQNVRMVLQVLAGLRQEQDGGVFFTAQDLSPISIQSLSELNIHNIVNNARLRRDINFEPQLFFRPNLDGQRGERKRRAQREYWRAVEVELRLYEVVYGGTTSDYLSEDVTVKGLDKRIQRRLPAMFQAIKDIVIDLVPVRDRVLVKQHLDVPLLMMQVEKQVLDFVKAAQTLAAILKRHCAPLRDSQIDLMVRRMQAGDAVSVAAALHDLLNILEAMKLDIANHQVRTLRGILIEDTIKFETDYNNQDRQEKWRCQLDKAKAWYLRQRSHVTNGEDHSSIVIPAEFKKFVQALVRLLMPECEEDFPQTFALDNRRLRALRIDIRELHFRSICRDVFEKLVNNRDLAQPRLRQALSNLQHTLQDMLSSSHLNDIYALGNIGLEIARHASLYLGHGGQPSRQLQCQAESLLRTYLDDLDVLYRHALYLETAIVESVLAKVSQERHLYLSAWDLFNLLVLPTNIPDNLTSIPTTQMKRRGPLDDVIRRISHIAVLHWRIWAPLVYLNDNFEVSDLDKSIEESDEILLGAGPPMDVPTRSPTPANTDSGRIIAKARDATTLEPQRLPDQVPESPVHPIPPSNVPNTHQP